MGLRDGKVHVLHHRLDGERSLSEHIFNVIPALERGERVKYNEERSCRWIARSSGNTSSVFEGGQFYSATQPAQASVSSASSARPW